MLTVVLKTTFFILLLFAEFGSYAQCYFSESSDSVLVVNSYRVSWDSEEHTYMYTYYYDIFTKIGHGPSTKLIGSYKGEYGGYYEGDTRPGFELHDSLLGNFKIKAEWAGNPEIDSLVSLDLEIEKVRNLKSEKSWCSKGCWWDVYYKMTANLRFSIRGDVVWNEHFNGLYFVNAQYIGWGDKPTIRNAKYFDKNPYACVTLHPYWSERFRKYFIYVLYSNRRINDNRDRIYNKSIAFVIE